MKRKVFYQQLIGNLIAKNSEKKQKNFLLSLRKPTRKEKKISKIKTDFKKIYYLSASNILRIRPLKDEELIITNTTTNKIFQKMKNSKFRGCLHSLVFVVSTFLLSVVQGMSLENGGRRPLASVDKMIFLGDEKFFETKLKRRSLPVPEKRDSDLTKQSSENIKTWKHFER